MGIISIGDVFIILSLSSRHARGGRGGPALSPVTITLCKKLAFQNTRLPVCAQLDSFGGGKNPSGIFGLMPVAGQEPVSRFVGMALARPVYEALLYEIIVLAHG
jgi:hypothetical protein